MFNVVKLPVLARTIFKGHFFLISMRLLSGLNKNVFCILKQLFYLKRTVCFHVYSKLMSPCSHWISLCEHPVLSLAVPIHGASESPLPALEDRNVFPTWAARTLLGCSTGQEHLVGALQLLQLFPGPPVACRRQKKT